MHGIQVIKFGVASTKHDCSVLLSLVEDALEFRPDLLRRQNMLLRLGVFRTQLKSKNSTHFDHQRAIRTVSVRQVSTTKARFQLVHQPVRI